MPGVTTRKLRVNRELCGRRTALTVCQAISIAMTVVLPVPVASLRASRGRSGLASRLALARLSRKSLPARPACDATSVSQMAVSTASIWQKKGRMSLKRWCRQCRSRRAVSGVTRHWSGLGRLRQTSTCRRTSLMMAVRSYCWPPSASFRDASSNTRLACSAAAPRRFFGLGMGLMNETRRRVLRTRFVGWPLSSSSQWRDGYS